MFLSTDNGHSTYPHFDNQPVNTGLIETANPLSQCSIGDQNRIADKLSVGIGQGHPVPWHFTLNKPLEALLAVCPLYTYYPPR